MAAKRRIDSLRLALAKAALQKFALLSQPVSPKRRHNWKK
jgi:hypothetical protein